MTPGDIIERGESRWRVAECAGPDAPNCADEAITLASVTGSRGATCERTRVVIDGSYQPDSAATVERLADVGHNHRPYEIPDYRAIGPCPICNPERKD